MPLLDVRNLATHFFTDEGVVRAVDGISFVVDRSEVLCLVGESGSGKSVASLSLLRLVAAPPGRIVAGEILFRPSGPAGEPAEEEEDLTVVSEARLRQIRGDRIAMVFQDPMTSLNPYLKVGAQLLEVLEIHQDLPTDEARDKVVQMLTDVGIGAPKAALDGYPHQLSGGMRQRVMIAMALLCGPDLLIADEPTTALDVTIQAQILSLIEERKNELGLAVLLITHDLGVVARMADRVAVMYAGRIVEQGSAAAVFGQPQHPYTMALQASIPRVDDDRTRRGELKAIVGLPPSAQARPDGCHFHPRCAHAAARCREQYPDERQLDIDGQPHLVSCHFEVGELRSEKVG
ncbi:MAG: ABC transporter ATP-binding protein [Pseudomonadota bacterium]